MLSIWTDNIKREMTVYITNTLCMKREFTVALAAHGNGNKLPAFVILNKPLG